MSLNLKEGEVFDLNTMKVRQATPEEIAAKGEGDKPDGDDSEEDSNKADDDQNDDVKDKEGDDADNPDGEKEEEFDTPDVYIKETLGEKFQINSEEELIETLESVDKLLEENEELKAKLEEKGETKPVFANAAQEKLFNFINDIGYAPEKHGEGLQTYARVMSIDKETDGRIVMEEKYILDHPELTREEAQYKFGKHYTKNFGDLKRDDFESDEEYKEAEKDRKIDKKSAEAKAREIIEKKQKEFKSSPDKKDETPLVSEAVAKGIEQTSKVYSEHLNQVKELVFSPTEDEDDDYAYVFKPEQLKSIRALCENWLKNPANYDKKGDLIGGTDPETSVQRAAFTLFGPDIVARNYEHAMSIASIQRAEEISTQKPNRVSKTGDAGKVVLSAEEQNQALIEQKRGKK